MTRTTCVAEWEERPFTGHRKRRATVYHRIVIEAVGGVGVDIRHEVRCPDLDGYPSGWTAAEVYEARQHGIEQVTADSMGWAI